MKLKALFGTILITLASLVNAKDVHITMSDDTTIQVTGYTESYYSDPGRSMMLISIYEKPNRYKSKYRKVVDTLASVDEQTCIERVGVMSFRGPAGGPIITKHYVNLASPTSLDDEVAKFICNYKF